MADNQSYPSHTPKHVPKRIPEFMAGDEKRTPFSAETMNELIRPINRVNNIIVSSALQIKYSDSNVWIGLKGDKPPTGFPQDNTNPFSSQTSLSSSFRGEWDVAGDYVVDDIVLRSDETAILSGNSAGTYICIVDAVHGLAPPPDNTTNWALFAQGHWDKLFIKAEDPISSSLQYFINLDPLTDIQAIRGIGSAPSMTIKLREVSVCSTSPSGSIQQKMIILGSEPY